MRKPETLGEVAGVGFGQKARVTIGAMYEESEHMRIAVPGVLLALDGAGISPTGVHEECVTTISLTPARARALALMLTLAADLQSTGLAVGSVDR